MARGSRPRQQRAESTVEVAPGAEDFVSKLRLALPNITDQLIKDATTSAEARELILKLMADDISRAKTAQATDLFAKLEQVRAAGSPILEKVWSQAYKNGVPV